MRLKKMEIVGFKSFGEKSVIAFPRGISAIVGPNGCGKSNIVDALRWAMGEMSVKQLRGKSMEDIIFAGTNGRPPMNLAEVSLTLANDNGTAPEELKDFTEIMLTRRLYRSGESLYMINRQPCRLKDIHNIFLGSGMGAKSYAVIQQGNIGAITDAGPEDRRIFIEEAAGITRYKQRKKETLRKLDATQQNRVRVLDIIAEVDRQMKGLDRQAKKAEAYRELQAQIRILDLRRAVGRHDGYTERIRKNDTLLKELRDADIEYAARLSRLDAAVEEIKLRRSRKNQEISQQRAEKFERQRRIDRAESDLAHRKEEIERLMQESANLKKLYGELEEKHRKMDEERAEVDRRNEALNTEIARDAERLAREKSDSQSVRTRLTELKAEAERHKQHLIAVVGEEAKYRNICQNVTQNKDHLKRRLRKVDEEVALAEQQRKGLQDQSEACRKRLARCRETVAAHDAQIRDIRGRIDVENRALADQVRFVRTLEYDRNQIRSQHAALQKMAQSFEWYRDGVKAVMASADPEEILGIFADVLEPSPEVIPAVESVLGEALQYVLVRDVDAGRAAVDRLRAEGSGRSGFVPVAALDNAAFEGREEGPDLLMNHVAVQPGFEGVARSLLGDVVLTDSMAAAIEGHRRNGRERTFVTRDGDLVSPRGVLIGGSTDRLSGILAKKQELKALGEQLSALKETLAAEQRRQESLEAAVRELEKALHRETEEKNEAIQEELGAEKGLIQADEAMKHAERGLEILRMEQDQLQGEADDIDEEMDRCYAALARITEDVKATQAKVVETDGRISAIASEAEAFEARIVDIKLRLTTRRAELENGLNTARRLQEFQADGRARIDQMIADIEVKERKRREAKAALSELENLLKRLYDDIAAFDASLKGSEGEYEEIEALLRERDGAITKVQGMREDAVRKIRMVEVEQSQLQIKVETIEGQVEERYQQPLAAFRAELADTAFARDMTAGDLDAELRNLRRKVAQMGDVHLGAIDEYKALDERHQFLTAQQADLDNAVADLHRVIRKINRISQEKFLETFEKINEKLAEVFPRLFSGGTARLELTEPGNPLETGVEFMVHPPGKRLTRLTLLSGGEKALSAIAFVFSIFLIKPAAFCIMDEIDAPLDEANVYRFNELLKIIGEKSQIIMITHKKKSMEFADTLFGITMEQKGVSRIVSVNLQGEPAALHG